MKKSKPKPTNDLERIEADIEAHKRGKSAEDREWVAILRAEVAERKRIEEASRD